MKIQLKKRHLKFLRLSSETIREVTYSKKNTFFNFTNFSLPIHIKKISQNFLEWFIGFAEADGCFYIKKEKLKTENACQKGKKRLIFEISQKDPKILYKIKKTLGFGNVTNYKNKKGEIYWIYKISSKENVKRIISLFDGNLILIKRKRQFHKWVKEARKLKCLPKNFQSKNLKNFVKISKQNAWLSGFLDGDGGFYANMSCPGPRAKVSKALKQKFFFTQKNEKKNLEFILSLLESKSKIQKFSNANKKSYFRIEISSLKSHEILIDYLTKFPLKTLRKISFLRWKRVFNARKNLEHLCEKNIPKLEKLCKNINKFN
jgi:hypothetical protein